MFVLRLGVVYLRQIYAQQYQRQHTPDCGGGQSAAAAPSLLPHSLVSQQTQSSSLPLGPAKIPALTPPADVSQAPAPFLLAPVPSPSPSPSVSLVPSPALVAPSPSSADGMDLASAGPASVVRVSEEESLGVIDINELIFIKILGEGTFGIVYSGEYRSTPVAIKQLRMSVLSPAQLTDFMREVTYLRLARHPNIVLFMGVCFNPYCIVTELLDMSLYQLLHVFHTQLSLSQQFSIARSISRAIVSLHSHNPPLMHRDLKSLNVLLSNDLSLVKICDLGLIKLKEMTTQFHTSTGTVLWMAPEMMRGESYDLSADIYSLALIFYEIHTGHLPYDGETNTMTLIQKIGIAGERPAWPSRHPHNKGTVIIAAPGERETENEGIGQREPKRFTVYDENDEEENEKEAEPDCVDETATTAAPIVNVNDPDSDLNDNDGYHPVQIYWRRLIEDCWCQDPWARPNIREVNRRLNELIRWNEENDKKRREQEIRQLVARGLFAASASRPSAPSLPLHDNRQPSVTAYSYAYPDQEFKDNNSRIVHSNIA